MSSTPGDRRARRRACARGGRDGPPLAGAPLAGTRSDRGSRRDRRGPRDRAARLRTARPPVAARPSRRARRASTGTRVGRLGRLGRGQGADDHRGAVTAVRETALAMLPSVWRRRGSAARTSAASPSGSRPTAGRRSSSFIAHWCPHCQAEVPFIQAWVNAGGVPGGRRPRIGRDRHRPDPPELSAGCLAPARGLDRPGHRRPDEQRRRGIRSPGYPYWVFIGPDGKVVARAVGEISMPDLESEIGRLTSGGREERRLVRTARGARRGC